MLTTPAEHEYTNTVPLPPSRPSAPTVSTEPSEETATDMPNASPGIPSERMSSFSLPQMLSMQVAVKTAPALTAAVVLRPGAPSARNEPSAASTCEVNRGCTLILLRGLSSYLQLRARPCPKRSPGCPCSFKVTIWACLYSPAEQANTNAPPLVVSLNSAPTARVNPDWLSAATPTPKPVLLAFA